MTPPLRYAKPAVLTSLPPHEHAIIEASAGTGKTYTLEHLYIDLLLRGATVDQILVVTFTEKATSELRFRVRSKLEELVLADGDRAPGLPEERTWQLDDAARGLLLAALQSFDAATIATIHAFCQRVLNEHAFANRQLFTLEQVDRRHAFGVAFKEALREEFARLEGPRRYLRAALALGTEVDRLEELLYACATAPGRLEPVYDERALTEALLAAPLDLFDDQEALRKSLKAAKIHGATIKGIVERVEALAPLILRFFDHRDPARYLQEFEALSTGTYGKSGSGPLDYPVSRLDGADLDDTGERLRTALRALERVTVPLVAALARVFLPRVQAGLSRRKRELGHYDFDDMLSLVHDSLHGPTGEQLARALRARYRYALIDEFQDTDQVQWGIFQKLFFDSPDRNLLFLIGDPKQAIYGFRGADVHTYVRARQAIVDRGGALLALEENFRSTPELIDACNLLLDQGAPSPYFSGTIRYDRPVRCGDPSQRALDLEQKPLPPVHVWISQGRLSGPEQLRRLGRRIALEIRRLTSPDAPLFFWHRGESVRVIGLRDIFVLTFSRREGLLIGDCLREAGIAHSFYKQDGLFETDEAAHVLDLLTAIDDPQHPAKRLRAWMTPFFGLVFEDAHRCRELPADHPLLARLHHFHGLARDKRYEQLFAALLEETGLLRRVLMTEGERQVTNYLHLFELLLEEVGRSRPSLRELLFLFRSYVEGRRRPPGDSPGVQRLESDQPAVQIMTMHKSKGLEAPVVFVAGGLARPRFPSLVSTYYLGGERRSYIGKSQPDEVKRAIAREEREEDERLLYVALTRARARLYLPYLPPTDKGVSTVTGSYGCVNDRLTTLLHAPTGPGPLFQVETLDDAPPPSIHEPAPTSIPAWATPEDALLPRSLEGEMSALKHARGGRYTTSYTALQRGKSHDDAAREADQTGEVAPELERGEDDLPGGAASGIFLHEVIESLDFDTFRRASDLASWIALDEVREVFARLATLHRIEPRHLPHAQRLIHTSLTTRIPLPGTQVVGLHTLSRKLCEVEFLFPMPGTAAAASTLDEEGRIRRDEGYVKGFIDFLFEHEGKLYFADWKSDGLRSWGRSTLEHHVHASYPRQLQLYSLAMVRMLGITDEASFEQKFGGVLYVFLRATGLGDGEGLYSWRPSWAQILAWELDLAQM